VELIDGGVCVAPLGYLAWRTSVYQDWSLVQAVLITLVALDLVGGRADELPQRRKALVREATYTMAVYLAALLVNLALFELPAALAWLAPVFF
jgi:hypothetical protein